MSNPPQNECSSPTDPVNTLPASSISVEAVLFDSERDTVPKPFSGTLGALLGTTPEIRPEKRGGRCFSLVQYRPDASRGNAGVATVNGVVLDFDHITAADLSGIGARLQGRLHAIYSTFGDRARGEDDRCVRVIVPTTRPMPPNEYVIVRAALVAEIGVAADEQAVDPARIWFMPATEASRAPGAFIFYSPTGTLLDPAAFAGSTIPPVAPPAPIPEHQIAQETVDSSRLTLRELKGRLRRLSDPDSRELLRPILSGDPFAEPGERDTALWRIMCTAAFAAPTVTPETLVALVVPSLTAMAAQHPEDPITPERAREMAARALRNAEERGAEVFERGDETEIAKVLLDRLSAAGPVVYDEGELWQYSTDDGLWHALDEHVISREIQALAGGLVVGSRGSRELKIDSKTVRGAHQLAAARSRRAGFFEGAAKGFAFRNGFVSVDACGAHLEPHHPDHRARVAMPFDFDPSASAPRFERFLDEVFEGDDDAAEKKQCIQEFTGACTLGIAPKLQKALVALGSGANGKSTLVEILLALFPAGAKSGIAPQDWEREYYRADLVGKRINAVAELPRADLMRSEAFKAIIAGDLIIGRPIRRSPVQFRPIAGHLFAANALPPVDDGSPAFWRRLVIMTFNRRFPDCAQEKDLAQTIISTEMPGIAVWALAGAARLLIQGAHMTYTIPSSHQAALDEWRLRADQVAEFIAEKTVPTTDPTRRTTASRLYAAYQRWAETNGHKPLASNKFGERVKALGVRHVKPHNERFYLVALSEDLLRFTSIPRRDPDESSDPVIERLPPCPPCVPIRPTSSPAPTATDSGAPHVHPPDPPGSPSASSPEASRRSA